MTKEEPPTPRGRFSRLFSILGPGLITGAADDDPSGIVTYSIAGAQYGLSMLWLALVTFPLMAAVQMMCARIGMVTGVGLTATLRKKVPRFVLIIMALSLFAANTVNIGADLFGMADVAELLTGWPTFLFIILFGVTITFATVWFKYKAIAALLKWLAFSLLAYVLTAFIARPDWSRTFAATFLPNWPASHGAWLTVVAILGTTISPYLFFWQASQEVELEKARGQRTSASRRGADPAELKDRALDVGTGAFVSNIVMYFIILTTALTLHKHGATQLETARQAAAALAPLAGRLASALYAAGLIGVGFLAIPTLAGSSAYVLAETFSFRQGLDEKLHRVKAFYGIFALSILFGMALCFAPIKPMDALFFTAVINGVLAPFLLMGVLWVACDRKVMGDQTSSWLARIAVGITTLGMFAAAVALFL